MSPFCRPGLLNAVVRAAQANKPLPKAVQGRLASRIAMPLDALLRLHQQLQQVLVGLRGRQAPQKAAKGQA